MELLTQLGQGFAAAATAVLYLVFKTWLGVPLP
jgi:hypothetical protein